MGFTVAAKNTMLNALAAAATYASLHSAAPGSTGANEISGGSPAYIRKVITWNTASSGNLDDANIPVFDVPAGVTVRFLGLWSAVSAGTFYGSTTLGSGNPVLFTAAVSDTFTAPAHGFIDTNTVALIDTAGNLPTGVVEETVYYIISATTDTFQLSLTSGGSAINLTTVGGGFVVSATPAVFTLQGTYTLDDGDVNLNL